MTARSMETGNDLHALLQLPKDKEILGFVLQKISSDSGPEQSDILAQLLEMHRTSNGFNPLELSKVRVKRTKAKDYKRIIREINLALQTLIGSQEYKELLRNKKNFGSVMTAFLRIQERLMQNRYDAEMTGELNTLKKDLIGLEEYELLLSLYRMCQGYFSNRDLQGEIPGLIEEYNQVKLMADLNSEHVITGLRTMELVNQAEKGARNNSALITLYDQLCKLLMRQTGTRTKYETLTRIIKVAAHLENRKHYMEPYLAYTQSHFEEIIKVLPAKACDLNITLAIFLNREPMPVRMAYLNKALEEAGKNRSQPDLALFKIIHAELCCDANDYQMALKVLDEADYILSKMNGTENNGEIILRAATTRFFIYSLLVMEERSTIEPEVFEALISIASSSGSKREDLSISSLELHGLFCFISGRISEAKNVFIKCARNRENQCNPVFYVIDTFFQELLRKNTDNSLLFSKITQLEQMKEPFYSTLCVRLLKGSMLRREAFAELFV